MTDIGSRRTGYRVARTFLWIGLGLAGLVILGGAAGLAAALSGEIGAATDRQSVVAASVLAMVGGLLAIAGLQFAMAALDTADSAREIERLLRAALARRPERRRDASAEPAGEGRPPRLAGPGPDERL